MVDIVTFDPDRHFAAWSTFVAESYRNPNYVLLSPAFLRWQFLDNPANTTGGYTLWLVVHRDAVVAQLGFVPFRGSTPAGGSFNGAYPINLIVRPDYRAVGLGAVILNKLIKQSACVLNPGSSDAGATLCIGLGMRDLGTLQRFIAIIDADQARTLARDGRLPAGMATAPQPLDGPLIEAIRQLPSDIPDRFEFPLPAYGAERSGSFLRWRYEQHPGFHYEFLLSEDREGLLVFHEEREPGSDTLVLRIVDLLARGSNQASLLRSVVALGRQRGAAIADFFCSPCGYDTALENVGFHNEADHAEDGRIAALFQPLDFRKTGIRVLVAGPAEASPQAAWYVAKGDSDQDRPNDARKIRSDVA
jgi:GNAT superfamily N-acetyltransferase